MDIDANFHLTLLSFTPYVVESNLSKISFITFSFIYSVTVSLIFTGCQAKTRQLEEQVITESVAPPSTVSPQVINKLPCKKFYSPPIQEVTKLKVMLMKSGKITSEMSDAEIKVAINQYIKNKRSAFKSCRK
ncbi:MAG: hypothetical protein ACI9LM_002618 [Alteromonadaceae bacterium]